MNLVYNIIEWTVFADFMTSYFHLYLNTNNYSCIWTSLVYFHRSKCATCSNYHPELSGTYGASVDVLTCDKEILNQISKVTSEDQILVHVYLCMCMCVYVYICMCCVCVCVCVRVCVYMCACLSVYLSVYLSIPLSIQYIPSKVILQSR